MTTRKTYENMSVFEQIKTGLEEAIAHRRGELSLKTTILPAPTKASKDRIRDNRKKTRSPKPPEPRPAR